MDYDGPTCIAVALLWIGDGSLPHDLAAPGIERVQPGVGCGDEDVVSIDAQATRGAIRPRRIRTDPVLPDQIAGAPIESLHRVTRICEIDDPVMNDRGGLIRSTFIHGPHPREAQVAYVLVRNLGKWTVTPCLVVTANHQPVSGIRISKHVVGDWRVIFDFSSYGQAFRSGRSRLNSRCLAEGLPKRRRHFPGCDRADQRSRRRV